MQPLALCLLLLYPLAVELATLMAPASFSSLVHSVSELGAQALPQAWILRAGFVALGAGALSLSVRATERMDSRFGQAGALGLLAFYSHLGRLGALGIGHCCESPVPSRVAFGEKPTRCDCKIQLECDDSSVGTLADK